MPDVCTKFQNQSEVVPRKSLTEKKLKKKMRKKNKQIKNVFAIYGCFCFVTQYKSSLSIFVPNFRNVCQVVAEKSLTEKSLQTDKYSYRKGKNYIPPIHVYTSYNRRLRRSGSLVSVEKKLMFLPAWFCNITQCSKTFE